MILLIRHGEADHHIHELTGGWTDSALTEKGLSQFARLAECLAKDFAGHPTPKVVASDLQRARTGAQIIAEKLQAGPVDCFSFLREKNNGRAFQEGGQGVLSSTGDRSGAGSHQL